MRFICYHSTSSLVNVGKESYKICARNQNGHQTSISPETEPAFLRQGPPSSPGGWLLNSRPMTSQNFNQTSTSGKFRLIFQFYRTKLTTINQPCFTDKGIKLDATGFQSLALGFRESAALIKPAGLSAGIKIWQ